METNYSYTVIPTKLMLMLDNKLQSVLFNLVQLSSVFADDSGFFYRSMTDLKQSFGMSENLVRASIETLYRKGLLSVKSTGFKAGKRGNTNYYKVNFDKFNQWEHLTLLQIYNIPKQDKIMLLNYKDKDYRITYTSTTKNEVVKPKMVVCEVERRSYNTNERRNKVIANANILIERLEQTTNWNEYQRKMTLFEKWLNECCNSLNDEGLKRELYTKARHTMDAIEFERETPTFDVDIDAVDEVLDDCPLMDFKHINTKRVSNNKHYIYCGDEAKGEEMTVDEAENRGLKLYLLKDTTNNFFYRTS